MWELHKPTQTLGGQHIPLKTMSEQDEQVVDSATSESQEQELEVNLDETVEEETIESLKAKIAEKDLQLAKEAEARRQLTARAKSAEAKPAQPQITNKPEIDVIERTVLKSQGMSDELLNELEVISKVRGKSLLDAQSDPIFVALKNAKDAEAKSAKAKLGVSRGSGTVKAEKSFNTPGLSDAEHKELFKQSQGR